MALLRNEYVMLGVPEVPDAVLAEILDEVFLPLVRGRDPPGGTPSGGPRRPRSRSGASKRAGAPAPPGDLMAP